MSESKWPVNVANSALANTSIRAIAGDSPGAAPDVKVREPNSVGYWRRNTLDVLKFSDRFTRYPENREEKAAWLREERMVKRLMKVQAKVIARYDRMHANKQGLNMPSKLIKDLANASPLELLRGDLGIVAHNVAKAQRELEQATGGRQTWLDPVVAIARDRAEKPLADGLPTFDSLAAENELLRAALFGKHGVRSGLDIIEKCLVRATEADHADAPFPYDQAQATIHHRAQQDAYRHTLEMVCLPEDLGMLADKENPAAAVLLRAALTYIESPEKVNVDWLAAALQRSIAGLPPIDQSAQDATSARQYTVIGHSDVDGGLFCEHVNADNGLNAFAVAAALHPDADFSAAVVGHLKEDGALHFPGESLVSASTIIEQHDVYGHANDARIPGFVLLFPGETEAAAAEMLTMLKSGGNTVFPVAAESAAALLEGISDGPWTRGQQWERAYNFSESEQDVANATWKLLNEYGFDPEWEMGPLEPGGDYRYAIELPQHEVATLRELQSVDSAIFPVNLPTHTASATVDASTVAGAGYALAFLDETQAVADELLESLRAGGVSVYRAAAGEAAMVLAEVAKGAGLEPEDFDIPW